MQLNPLFSAAVVVVVVVVVEHVGTSEAKKVLRTVGRGETEKRGQALVTSFRRPLKN